MDDMRGITVPVFYLSHIFEYLRRENIDPDVWLSGSGLSADKLTDGSTQIPLNSWLTLLESAISLSGKADLGAHIGTNLSIRHHGALGLAITNCESLQELVAILCTYVATRNPLIRFEQRTFGNASGLVIVECVPLGGIGSQIVELVISSVHTVLSQLFPDRRIFDKVMLSYTPGAYHRELAKRWNTEVVFEQQDCVMVFCSELMGCEITGRDAHMLALARQLCEAELRSLNSVTSIHSRVRQYLIETGAPFPSLQETAARFAMTSRTLHRKLVSEGYHFRKIVQDVRREWSRAALLEDKMDVGSVASLLGYSDTANFRRAFKQWFGCTPADMKNNQGKS